MQHWQCLVCGYIGQGEAPPARCPLCGSDGKRFKALELRSVGGDAEVAPGWLDQTQANALILAYGRRAEEEGYPEIASALYRIADEKARQAAEWFTLARSPDGTGENLHRQMRREEAGAKTCLKMAGEARKAGDTEVALFYERTAAEGRRHEAVVRALLRRFFGG